MHSIHLHDLHLSKSHNMFALSVGEMVWFSLAILFFLLTWFVGGDEFQESIGGAVTLVVLLAGIVLGAILCAVTKPK